MTISKVILTCSRTNPLAFLHLSHSFLADHVDAHSLCVQTFSLSEVDYIEAYGVTGLILHREIKPLMMASGVSVHSHVQVVLLVALHRDHI